MWNYRLNVVASNTDISFYGLLAFVLGQIQSILFLNGGIWKVWGSNKTTWTSVFYELKRDNLFTWTKFQFQPARSLHSQLQNFRKHSWKHWLSVKFRLTANYLIGCGFIGLVFINHFSIYIETFRQRCSTRNSMTHLDDDLSQNWQTIYA